MAPLISRVQKLDVENPLQVELGHSVPKKDRDGGMGGRIGFMLIQAHMPSSTLTISITAPQRSNYKARYLTSLDHTDFFFYTKN